MEEKIALTIIEKIPVGPFKSTDCKDIIKTYFQKHPLASADGATFGSQFLKNCWPFLEKYGVKILKNKSPRKYEMTELAKKKVRD